MGCQDRAHAGDKIDFRFDLPDYPAGAGWACAVKLRAGDSVHTVALAADGDAHVGTATAAASAAWPPGIYDLYVLATKGADRQTAHTGKLVILPDPAADAPQRTALEMDLVRVDAAISAVLAGEGVQAYSIQTQAGSRNIQRMSLADLRAHRSWLQGLIDSERVAMGEKPKNRRWRTIGLSFR